MIEAALKSMLPERSFVLQQLQPEGSLVFGNMGAGWTGVYRWCKQATARGCGRLAGDAMLFQNYDLLLLHLDADVAGMRYSDDNSITTEPSDGVLPCEQPCPPASASTNALRTVLMSWCGDAPLPSKIIICMPSKSTEARVVAALFPDDLIVTQGIECFVNPESRLGQQPKAKRIKKRQRDYQHRAQTFETEWSNLKP